MSKSVKIASIREDYSSRRLDERDVLADPLEQFRLWMNDALEAGIDQPNAMTLATATRDGSPSARIVLLKEVDDEGFVFFTNYTGRKARDLEENPSAALVFWWLPLSRQVRVEGTVSRVSGAESDAYFKSRPLGSQIGAWASPQSEVIPDRSTLEHAFAEIQQRFSGDDVPRPPHWGGYRVTPHRIEFWQGRPSRLHDRLCYRRPDPDAQWMLERLAP